MGRECLRKNVESVNMHSEGRVLVALAQYLTEHCLRVEAWKRELLRSMGTPYGFHVAEMRTLNWQR